MKRICLIKGQSQYDTTRTFIDQLGIAFRSRGATVHEVDMTLKDWPVQLAAAFEEPLAFVFSFNAVGMDVATEDGPIYDRMRTLFVTSLMDHPVYHTERLSAPVQRALVLCVDRTHARFLHRLAKSSRSTGFLPHGGMQAAGSGETGPDRDLDVVFSGTYVDPDSIRARWMELPDPLRRVLEDASTLALADPTLPIVDAIERALHHHQLWLEHSPASGAVRLTQAVDTFIRARRRQVSLAGLAEGGVHLDLFGDNWETAPFSRGSSVRVHPSVDYSAMLQVMQRAKVVLNILPGFPDGSHDRVFCGMLNGAVVATDTNPYLSEFLRDGENSILVPTHAPPAILADRLRELLPQKLLLRDWAARGRDIARFQHTWAHRAEAIDTLAEIMSAPGVP